jgi:hypothetical protein
MFESQNIKSRKKKNKEKVMELLLMGQHHRRIHQNNITITALTNQNLSQKAIITCLSALLVLSSSTTSKARILRSVLPSRSANFTSIFFISYLRFKQTSGACNYHFHI